MFASTDGVAVGHAGDQHAEPDAASVAWASAASVDPALEARPVRSEKIGSKWSKVHADSKTVDLVGGLPDVEHGLAGGVLRERS